MSYIATVHPSFCFVIDKLQRDKKKYVAMQNAAINALSNDIYRSVHLLIFSVVNIITTLLRFIADTPLFKNIED